MDDNLHEIRRGLAVLTGDVRAGRLGRAAREWGGAGVVLASIAPTKSSGERFYPEPRYVITRFALELSWLFEILRDLFSTILDSTIKIEFYGRLANAANRYLARQSSDLQNAQDLLFAVTHEAFAIVDEMEEGSFRFQSVALGNGIWDDLIHEAEKSGYLGPEATRRFLEDMETRHHDA